MRVAEVKQKVGLVGGLDIDDFEGQAVDGTGYARSVLEFQPREARAVAVSNIGKFTSHVQISLRRTIQAAVRICIVGLSDVRSEAKQAPRIARYAAVGQSCEVLRVIQILASVTTMEAIAKHHYIHIVTYPTCTSYHP